MFKGHDKAKMAVPLAAAMIFSVASRLLIGREALSSGLMLLSMPCILFSARLAGTRREYLMVLFAETLCHFARYCTNYGETPAALAGMAMLTLLISLFRTLIMVADSRVMHKKSGLAAVLIYPALTLILEAAFDRTAFGNAINPVTFLYSFPAFLQTAAVLTEYGMTFLLLLAVSVSVYVAQRKKAEVPSVILCAVLLILSVLPGSIRFKDIPEGASGNIRVAFVTSAECPFYDSIISDQEDIDQFIGSVERASADNADLLMSVEEHLTVERKDLEAVLGRISSAARAGRIYVLAGFEVKNGEDKEDNLAYMFDRDGRIICEYKKNTLVPFIEAPFFNEGDGKLAEFVIEAGVKSYNAAMGICFDGNNGFLMSQMNDETDILLLPAWEWPSVNVEQLRNNRITPVRNGVTLIKAVQDGFHVAVDPYGRLLFKTGTLGRYLEYDITDIPIYE